MKTLVLAVIFMFCLNLTQAQERPHKKPSRVGRATIKYQGEKPYRPSFGRKKTVKRYMFAGENMHPDSRFR